MAPTYFLSESLRGVDHYDLLGIDPRTGRETLQELRQRARAVSALLARPPPAGQTAQPLPFTLAEANTLRDWLNQVEATGYDNAAELEDIPEEDRPEQPVVLTNQQLLDRFYERHEVHNRAVRSSWNPFANPSTGSRLTTADPALLVPLRSVVPGAPPSTGPSTGGTGRTYTTARTGTNFAGGPSYTTWPGGPADDPTPRASGRTTAGRPPPGSSTGRTGPTVVLDDDDDAPVSSPPTSRQTGPLPHRQSPPRASSVTSATTPTGPPAGTTTGPPPMGFVHIPAPPPGLASAFARTGHGALVAQQPPPPAAPAAPVPPPPYTGPTDYHLPTLELRAADPTGQRIVIGLVRPVDGQGNIRPVAPVLIATVGADALGRVNFRVRSLDINGRTTGGAGQTNSLNWTQLNARGLVLLGRFRGATEAEVRQFAVDRSNRTNPASRLPLHDRSPRGPSSAGRYSSTKTGETRPRRSKSPDSPSDKGYRRRDPPAGGAGGAASLLT